MNPSSSIREGRGRKTANDKVFTVSPFRVFYDLVSTASSASAKANIKLARKLVTKYAEVKKTSDPFQVTPQSSKFVLILLADYCKFGTPESLKNDSMGALVQGMRHVYSENGHKRTWFVNEANSVAHGNPLIGNPELDALRRAHRVHLAHFGSITLRPRPITAEHICDMAKLFWYGSGRDVSVPDVLLHSVLVIGLNLGLSYDEITKLKVENMSVGSDGCTLTLNQAIKNSTAQRTYTLRDWEGNTKLRFSYIMDPFLAIYSWLAIRGSTAGPLFCGVREPESGPVIDTSGPWSAKKFTEFLRKRLSAIGVGEGDLQIYSDHSIKRGSVQLYRSLGMRDKAIMEIIQMSGPNAYANYCAAYNDCDPKSLPRFNSISHYIQHAETVAKESDIVHNQEAFAEFMIEVWGEDMVYTDEVISDLKSVAYSTKVNKSACLSAGFILHVL